MVKLLIGEKDGLCCLLGEISQSKYILTEK